MNLLDIVTLLGNDQPRESVRPSIHVLPRLFALSKTGAIRVYEIIVEDKGDYAEMTTRKKVTLKGKWTEDKYQYYEGVNIGKSNETTYLEQAEFEAKSAWKKLLDAGFSTKMPDPSDKFNTDANGKLKPMLAVDFNKKQIKFPCLCQPKYDGVRCTISEDNNGINIISRKGKTYNIPHLKSWAEKHRELLPLDGELYNHKELSFEQIVSAVKRLSDITNKIRYVVYDRPIDNVDNRTRWSKLQEDYKNVSKDAPTYLSPSRVCKNFDEIFAYHDECVAQGYEGAIIRNFDGLYEFGFRSNNLIKYKEFQDSEFQIADIIEASGRDAGTAIFVLYLPGHEGEEITSDNTFKAKPKGTRELRTEYFDRADEIIGKQATIKYQGLSDNGVPRFPSAISVRDYE